MKPTDIEYIWQSLESDDSLQSGLLYKRYSPTLMPDIYVALKAPERLRCIAFHIDKNHNIDLKNWDTLKDIKLETVPDKEDSKRKFLLVLLLSSEHIDIFSSLSEDLILSVETVASENELIDFLLTRLAKWQAIFEKAGLEGLSLEKQRGLYGELFFLRRFIENSNNSSNCVASWKGPENAVQDFQAGEWAVEVKTTHGKNHQKIFITSERQLDTAIVPLIYLFHLSLEIREEVGETLNEAVMSIRELLSDNYQVANSFEFKLLQSGYFDSHRSIYSSSAYSIRQLRIYQITEGFPRITESQITGGVGDVRYSIVVSDDVPWSIRENELFNQISE